MAICKGPNCGREVLWVESMISTSKVPLEECKHVYRIIAPQQGTKKPIAEQITEEKLYIGHFLTCPDRKSFSGKNKKLQEIDPELLIQEDLLAEPVEGDRTADYITKGEEP